MKIRMSRCAALIGTVLSLSSFAQDCQEISLYKDGSEKGKLENSSFPESPEWAANWGNLDGMNSPYIRLSGQKNAAADWTGEFSFNKMPVNVKGGNLKLKIRSTQKGTANIWLAGNFGKSSTYTFVVNANQTYSLEVPVTSLLGTGTKSISRVGVGLKNVPAYQYTTLFVDDISFTCGSAGAGNSPSGNSQLIQDFFGSSSRQYTYSDVPPGETTREGKFLEDPVRETSAAFDETQRKQLADSTTLDFVVSPMEQMQLKRFVNARDLTPLESKMGWFRSLYLVERNRLKDHVIANPKALFYEAENFATGNDGKSMPLLLGNVDYGYKTCLDTLCEAQKIVPGRLLLAGFPVGNVRGSVVNVHYDPYFLTTNRKSYPTVELYVDGGWKTLSPKSEMKLQFKSAGLQRVRVRLSEGGVTVNQVLFLEVK